jgi:cytochrome c
MTRRVQGRAVRMVLDTVMAGLAVVTIACDAPSKRALVVPGGDPDRGRVALRAYGCGGCHAIPGLPEARGAVGPSLVGLANRTHIAGRLTNGPLNLAAWIKSPRSVDPGTIMPDLGVTAEEAWDIAAYLYSRGPLPSVPPPRWPPVSNEMRR